MYGCQHGRCDWGRLQMVGDSVEIFGEHVTVDELAEILDTIPYEVLTSVSTRVKRIYYRE